MKRTIARLALLALSVVLALGVGRSEVRTVEAQTVVTNNALLDVSLHVEASGPVQGFVEVPDGRIMLRAWVEKSSPDAVATILFRTDYRGPGFDTPDVFLSSALTESTRQYAPLVAFWRVKADTYAYALSLAQTGQTGGEPSWADVRVQIRRIDDPPAV